MSHVAVLFNGFTLAILAITVWIRTRDGLPDSARSDWLFWIASVAAGVSLTANLVRGFL